MPTAPSLRQSQDILVRSISDLKVLGTQLAGLDDIKAEQQKAQAQLDVLKQNVAGMKINFDEVKREYDKILAAAHAKQAECGRLDEELKAKTKELGDVCAQMQQMRQRLGG
jgi:chromosome segregation ATPase